MSTGEDTLKALGYQQELHRSVSSLGHIPTVLSEITPTASILVVATAVIAVGGTGSLLPFILGRFIAINVALHGGTGVDVSRSRRPLLHRDPGPRSAPKIHRHG